MNRPKYKDQSNENYKKILIVLFVVIFVLLFISLILSGIEKKNNKQEISYDSLDTIKDVIEYYGSTYISESDGPEKGYPYDVYLKFKYLPYNEDDTSNEEYYNNLIRDGAKAMRHFSFRLIDEENDIIVRVKCKNYRVESYTINDIEDYFIYMDSQISMKKYVEIPTTDFEVQSSILKACIDNSWKEDMNFGTRDSIFNQYLIYQDEGIKVRNIDGKIYNIIFTKNYSEKIVNNLSAGLSRKDVEDILGDATFTDEKLEVFGYKGKDFYIFFTPDEVSVYRVYNGDTDDFFKLADKLIAEDLGLLEFMNELTYMWPDYSEYTYGSNNFFVAYPLKGIEITLKSSDISGILVYNSIKSTMSKIQPYLENTYFVARLQIDSVYEAEKRRYSEEVGYADDYKYYINSIEEKDKNIIGSSMYYKEIPQRDADGGIYSMRFVTTSLEKPSRELNDSISTYLWLTNDIFIYSKQGEGIFSYNLNNGIVQRIIEGNDNFELRGFENGILKYDSVEVPVQY